jgi:hypothetical protein
MLQDTIARLEAKLNQSADVNPQTREELLRLLRTLQDEVAAMARDDAARADRIAEYANASASEVAHGSPSPERLQGSLGELSRSVEGFETTYPRLVEVVNRLASTLANLGIPPGHVIVDD